MGRGGGSSGGRGGSFHGGSSSRTHYGSSGGRGGRSSGSRPGPGPRPGPRGPHYHAPPPPPRRRGRVYGPAYGGGCMGCSSVLAAVIILIVVLIIVGISTCSFGREEIRESTLERTKLPSADCKKIGDWYEDHMPSSWIHNERELIDGMQAFYSKTGVQPYLVLLPDVDGDKNPSGAKIENKLREIYEEIMPDGGHVIVGFVEGKDSEYATAVCAGAQAEAVMDEEAREILMDYLDYYYTSDLEDEAYFATAFEKTAEKIMKIDEIKSQSVAKIVIIIGVVLIVIVIAVAIVRSKKHKAEQAKADAEILNSDVSGASGTDPLKEKYNVGNDEEK